MEQLESFLTQAQNLINSSPIIGHILGAILLAVIGRMLAGWVRRVIVASLERKKVDSTLVRYADSIIQISLNLLIVIAIFSVMGVETTSFAALFAAVGLAIGTAWGGLLANFAAGVFLIVLRPFKVGDMISGAGVTGVVHEIGLFATTIDQADNVRVFVGNNKLFGDNIQNYTRNPYRRVDLKAQLPHEANVRKVIEALTERLKLIPNVSKEQTPSVALADFTPAGPVLAVRPFCHNDHYWDVYFATNEAIVEVCGKLQLPPAAPHVRHINVS